MTAYIVFLREGPVHNEAEMQEYMRKTMESPPDARLTPLVIYGAQTQLEGQAPDGILILQFASAQDAKDWYYGADYQSRIKHRLAAANYRTTLVEGFSP